MGVYLYFYLNGDGSMPVFDSAEADTADEALKAGVRLLQRAPERVGVEVWEGEHRITTLRRDELGA